MGDNEKVAEEICIQKQMFVTMEHQVGGHATTKTSLKSYGGKILKPFQNQSRGEKEHAFYEQIFHPSTAENKPLYKKLQAFVPSYYGTITLEETTKEQGVLHNGKYLVLGDLTWKRQWPCIMDVKVGTRSYEDDATQEKIEYERSKFPLQEKVGFRIQGIKVYDTKEKKYVEYDKHFGRGMKTHEAIVDAFRKYFYDGNTIKREVIEQFLGCLQEIEKWFKIQNEFEFIASSLLFLYDGEVDSNSKDPSKYKVDVRLIDFAHVHQFKTPQIDKGVLLGIQTTIQCFQQLLETT